MGPKSRTDTRTLVDISSFGFTHPREDLPDVQAKGISPMPPVDGMGGFQICRH